LVTLEEAEAEMTASSGEAVGRLRISAPVSFGLMHLAMLWPRFMRLHPNVELDVTLGDRVVDLVEEGYDLAVRIARLPNSSMISRQLTSTRLTLCASPAYLQQFGVPVHPSQLANHSVLAYTLLAMGETWEFLGPEGAVSVKVSPRMRSNSGDTCCAAALYGQGIVLKPSFLVENHIQSGALIEILPTYRSVDLGVYVVYPSRKHVSPKVRAMVDFLTAAFAS
jgi:DNA-binding transcriptional LysR family regulator